MARLMKPHLLAMHFIFWVAAFGQVSPQSISVVPHEPPNLGNLKIRLTAYQACRRPNCYQQQLDRQATLAVKLLQERVARKKTNEKLALVLDIDETALSNWNEEALDDFGYISKDWNAWVDRKQAPAIPTTLVLFNEAKRLNVAVFFITGRSVDQEAATQDNLKSAGYSNWSGIAFRGPHPDKETTRDFKSGERRKIVARGYALILNVGDQFSDLAGFPEAEKSVKLPNPFYFIP